MSLNTLLTTVVDKIRATHINDILSAFRLQFVGRNSSGVATSGQSLGTSAIPWGNLFCTTLTLNNSVIDDSNIVSPKNRIISGAVRTLSEQSKFFSIDGSTAAITTLGATTDLATAIDGLIVTVTSDIALSSLTVAPSSNNTCLINEPTFADEDATKFAGEVLNILNIDAAGSEITSRVGQIVALQKNTDSNEIMLAYVKSSTELTNCYRGFFFDSSDNPIKRETIANNDQFNILSLGWIFLENTGSDTTVTYVTPIYSFTEPPSPATNDYWFDITNETWKRFDGADFVVSNRTLIGICAINTTKTVGHRSGDYFHNYRNDNTIELEINTSDTDEVRSKDKNNTVYSYSQLLRIDPDRITWDLTANFDTGAVAASTIYYLYIASTGARFISLEKDYTRNDLNGRYHPYEAWRFVGKGTTNVSSKWDTIGLDDTIENLTIENLVIDKTLKIRGNADIYQPLTNSMMRNWTAVGDMQFSTTLINGITYSEPLNLFVAVGSSGKGSNSSDGVTWTAVGDMKFSTDGIFEVVYSELLNLFVAVGTNGKGSNSSDGVTWTAVGDMKFSTTLINSIAYSELLNLFVAVGNTGKGSNSSDGITWTAVGDMKFSTTLINSIAYSELLNLFVAVGNTGKGATSSDGITWTAVGDMQFSSDNINGMAYSEQLNLFVVVGNSGKGATSSDGATWTAVGDMKFSTDAIFEVAYSKQLNLFVAVGLSGKGAYSSDGVTWTAIGDINFSSGNANGLAYSENINLFVAVGQTGKGSHSL